MIDFACGRTCERIIQILIGDEDSQVATNNFLELDVPNDLREKFEEIDRKEVEADRDEKRKESQTTSVNE